MVIVLTVLPIKRAGAMTGSLAMHSVLTATAAVRAWMALH